MHTPISAFLHHPISTSKIFTPIRNHRHVRLLQKYDSAWNEVFILEPWRDSNKLYAGVRGFPLGETYSSDPEDFGFTEKEIVNPSILDNFSSEELSSFRHLLGGAWVGAPSMTDEGNSWQITDATRFGVAVHDEDQWQFVFFIVGDVFPNKLRDKQLLLEIVNQTLDLTTADLILPLLEPKRVLLPSGAVFFG